MKCETTKEMWDNLSCIYGGDKNVLWEKSKCFKGKVDDMRMQEDETIV